MHRVDMFFLHTICDDYVRRNPSVVSIVIFQSIEKVLDADRQHEVLITSARVEHILLAFGIHTRELTDYWILVSKHVLQLERGE